MEAAFTSATPLLGCVTSNMGARAGRPFFAFACFGLISANTSMGMLRILSLMFSCLNHKNSGKLMASKLALHMLTPDEVIYLKSGCQGDALLLVLFFEV